LTLQARPVQRGVRRGLREGRGNRLALRLSQAACVCVVGDKDTAALGPCLP
jgi:hypothetical protein